MTTDDRDDRIEELLREALQEEADTVVPSGDGLSRIQGRVRANRTRRLWLRPAFALGGVALLAGAGIGVYAATHGSTGEDRVIPGSPSPSTGPSTSSTPTVTPVDHGDFPALAIFPFTTVADEQNWESAYADGHQPWIADPTAVAQSWVQNYLGQSAIDTVVDPQVDDGAGTADITLGRTMQAEQKSTVAVTDVHLVKYGKAWVVVGASDPQHLLSLTAPDPGSSVTSPVTVTGPGFGVDESATVQVLDATKAGVLGFDNVGFGSGTNEWSASVTFSKVTSGVGVVVAVESSAADGGPQRLVAEQVHASGGTLAAVPPPYFYGVKNGRITKFASRNGAALTYLTQEEPGGGPSDPQLVGDNVDYLQGAGTCANALMRVPISGGKTTLVASPDDGYVITSYADYGTGQGVTRYALYEQACDSGADPQAQLVFVEDNSRNVIKYRSVPPGVVGDPSYEPPAAVQYVDAIVRTGNQSYLARFDDVNESSPTPSKQACPQYDVNSGQPLALEMDSTGVLWIATQTGQSIDVVRCAEGKAKPAFSIAGNRQPADVDVTADGGAVLVTDTDGHVWRWDGQGNAVQLSPSIPLTDVTW